MPISVNWQDDHQDTLLYTIASPWSLDEMYAALTRSYELTRASAKAPRYILFDVSRSDSLPQGFLSALRHLESSHHKDVELRVLIGANRVLRAVFNVVGRVTPQLTRQMMIAPDLPAALEMVEAHRCASTGET